jgi:Nucleotidyltransferase of unknown function (DUF6036)
VRLEVSRDRLRALLREIAETAPRSGPFRVYLVGGGTAVYLGWRPSSVDADLYSEQEEVFRGIQRIKEHLQVNVEFARPEDFVPPLPGTADRHVFIESIGAVDVYHYDPYAQVLSKLVRGFARDVDDARHFVQSGMVSLAELSALVERIPEAEYARYPHLSAATVRSAVEDFRAAGD